MYKKNKNGRLRYASRFSDYDYSYGIEALRSSEVIAKNNLPSLTPFGFSSQIVADFEATSKSSP